MTFPYKCSMRSTLCQLPAPAGKSQLFSTSVVSTQSTFWQLQLESRNFSVVCAVDFGSLGIGWVSVWVSVWALQIYDSAILACDNNLDLTCVFMASGGIVFSSSVSVYNGFGLRNKLRDGPLHNEKARSIFLQPNWCPKRIIPNPNVDSLLRTSKIPIFQGSSLTARTLVRSSWSMGCTSQFLQGSENENGNQELDRA